MQTVGFAPFNSAKLNLRTRSCLGRAG